MLVADDAIRLRQLLERREPRLDAEARKQVREQVQRAAVDRGAADDFVARLQQPEQRRRRRRLPARQQHRRLGALERGDRLLHRRDRGIAVARVEELRRPPLVVGAHLLRVLEQERRRLVDRRGQRVGVAGRCPGCPARSSVLAHGLACSRKLQSVLRGRRRRSHANHQSRLDRDDALAAGGDDRLDELVVRVLVAAVDAARRGCSADRTARRRRRRNRAARAGCARAGST